MNTGVGPIIRRLSLGKLQKGNVGSKPDPSGCESQVHSVPHAAVEPHRINRVGGATGAGVPCPVHPKSQTQRRATANPSTDGTAASHRQREAPAVSARNPSQPGSS